MIAGFVSWQNNQFVIRAGYLIIAMLFIIYQSFIGGGAIITQVIMLLTTFISILYYSGLK